MPEQLHEIADTQAHQSASLAALATRLDALATARIAPLPPDPLDAAVKRLQAENLAAQTKKARTDRRVAYLAPLATAVSVLLGFAGIFIQQRLTARANLTVKALELVMTADTPFVAEARYYLLQRMFGRSPPAQFQGKFNRDYFPGLRLYALALEQFKAAAAKCEDEGEVRMLFASIFPDWEAKWQPDQAPAAPQPQAAC